MGNVDDKRTAIIEATLRLVAEFGFHGTAMSKVAKEAGVSAGIIYHYFANKDELIVQTYLECKQELSKVIIAQHDPSLPLRAQIQNLWGAMIREMLARPMETTFKAQFYTSPYNTPEVEEMASKYFAPISGIMEKGVKEMIIKDLPWAVFGALIMDVPYGLVRREAAGQVELTDELIEETVEALWQAVRM